MAQTLGPIFGTGKNGILTVSGNTNWEYGSYGNLVGYGSCTGTAGTKSLYVTDRHGAWCIVAGDIFLIHQTQGIGAGQWEMNIARETFPNSTSASVSIEYPLVYNYGTGAQVVKVPQFYYANISATLSVLPWTGTYGGIFAFMCNGPTTVSGIITASGKGFRGGVGNSHNSGYAGEGTAGPEIYYDYTANNGSGGGGGCERAQGGCGGGGGGNGATGNPGGTNAGGFWGAGGYEVGSVDLTTMNLGGGGGGGGGGGSSDSDVDGAPGSPGGGIIFIISKKLDTSGGYVYSIGTNGANGGSSNGRDAGGGGGGAGGSILMKYQSAILGTNRIVATGGSGGYGPNNAADGGAAATGRVRIEGGNTSGTTNPAFSSYGTITPWSGRVGISG